jgi:hypothetical protein
MFGMPMLSLLPRMALLMCFASAPAIGAEIGRHPTDSAKINAIYFHGDIRQGDAKKLKNYLQALPKRRDTIVYLNSSGGSFRDGIDMGYLFRTEGIRTFVETGGICGSSCALAFLGGFDKKSGKPWRTKSSTARLAFHGFYAKMDKASYSADEVESLLFNNSFAASKVILYFRDVDGDWSLLSSALRMRELQTYDVSDAQALEIGIHVWDERSKKLRLSRTAQSQ